MKALVIGSCTKRKRYAPSEQPDCSGLDDPVRHAQKERELHAYELPAIEMYTGQHHLHVREGLQLVWNKLDHESASLVIVSAGYGVLQCGRDVVRLSQALDVPEGPRGTARVSSAGIEGAQ